MIIDKKGAVDFGIISTLWEHINSIPDGMWQVIVRKPIRTTKQNSAMHEYFTLLSDKFNEIGVPLFVQIGKRQSVERQWTPEAVKEYIWRPVQLAITKKKSTTKLTTSEIDKIYIPINKWLGDDYQLHIPFPHEI